MQNDEGEYTFIQDTLSPTKKLLSGMMIDKRGNNTLLPILIQIYGSFRNGMRRGSR